MHRKTGVWMVLSLYNTSRDARLDISPIESQPAMAGRVIECVVHGIWWGTGQQGRAIRLFRTRGSTGHLNWFAALESASGDQVIPKKKNPDVE